MRATFALFRPAVILALAALALAACQTDGTPPPAASPAATPEPAARESVTVAFEPITGVPDERAGMLATALVSEAVDLGVDLVTRDQLNATYRMQGFFTATTSGNRTAVTYVWDIFALSGSRAHRITGTRTIDAALPDPWQAVSDETLARIGRDSAASLAEWLASMRARDDAPAAGQDETATGAGNAGLAGSVAPVGFAAIARAAPADPSAVALAQAALPRAPRFTYFIGGVTGATSDGAIALPVALAAELDLHGGARVARAEDADYLINGEAAVNPASRGAHEVALIWTVRTRSGDALGTVRQVSRIAESRLQAGWGSSADHAAAAAAPGVLSLIGAR